MGNFLDVKRALQTFIVKKKENIRETKYKKYDCKITQHWIFKAGNIVIDYSYDIKEEHLLSSSAVQDILTAVRLDDRRDDIIMKNSIGRWKNRSTLWWVCRAATNSPSVSMLKLARLLLTTITKNNKKKFIETVAPDIHIFSDEIWQLILQEYDGDIIWLSASRLLPYRLTNTDYEIILDVMDEKEDDTERTFIECSKRYYVGRLLIQGLTAWRKESALCTILRRLSLQSRRKLLTYGDMHHFGMTSLQLTRVTYVDLIEILPPGHFYYSGDVNDNLIQMLKFFCNEYSVYSGITFTNHTVRTDVDSDCVTLCNERTIYECNHQQPMNVANIAFTILNQVVEDVAEVQPLTQSMLLESVRLLPKDLPKVFIVQLLIASVPSNKSTLVLWEKKMMTVDLPKDAYCWILFTVSDLRALIEEVLLGHSGLLSSNQLLDYLKDLFEAHQSVMHISELRNSSRLAYLPESSPAYPFVTSYRQSVNLIPNTLTESFMSKQKKDAQSLAITYLTVNIETVDSQLPNVTDLMPTETFPSKETIPKVVFVQVLVEHMCIHKPDYQELDRKLKPFILPTDFSWWFIYTNEDKRGIIDQHLKSTSLLTFQQKLSHLRQQFTVDQSVIYVSALFSSLGRRLVSPLEENFIDHFGTDLPTTIISDPFPGSALVIYMTAGRSFSNTSNHCYCRRDWENELTDVEYILDQQLGLTVTKVEDISREEMLEQVKGFAKQATGDKFSVVTVMSHGDENDSLQASDGSVIDPQEVVDAFNQHGNQPKIVLMQYCRGKSNYNRLCGSYEDDYVRRFVQKRPKQITILEKVEPKRRIILPSNFFVVYSTLQDGRAKRGLFFDCVRKNLFDTWRASPPHKTTDIIMLMADVAGSLREKSSLFQHIESVDTLLQPLHIILYPNEELHKEDIDKETFLSVV